MKKLPTGLSTGLAGLALTSVLLTGCSATDDASLVLGSTGSVDAQSTSLSTTSVTELAYADLGIDPADLDPDLSEAVEVTLADGASEGGSGVEVDGDTVTISAGGTYRVTGTLSSGTLVVDAADEVVDLVLDGVDITAADVAALHVVEAERVVVHLAEGSQNVLADDDAAVVDESVEDAPNATLFSTADLWIAGDGALSVTAHAADAITSKDSLVLAGGEVTVRAADDGVRGKDHLVITGGTLTADVAGDALRSDNESVADDPEAAVGVIWIDGGTLDLTAGADAVDAARQVSVLDGDVTIAAGDDGLHSDQLLRIDGGRVSITESLEGVEAAYMFLSGGDVSVVATDDGINVSGGTTTTDETSEEVAAAPAERPEGGPPGDGGPGGAMGAAPGGRGETVSSDPVADLSSLTVTAMEGSGFGGPAEGENGSRFLEVSGGTYVIDTDSDGVDVNGTMTMSGGTLVVSGTDDVRNGALDVDDGLTLTGGTLAANGTATMAVAPAETSTQASLALTFGGTVPAGTLVTISDVTGEQLASFTTAKDSSSLVYSSAMVVAGAEYDVAVGGEVVGDGTGWLVEGGAATGGEVIGTVAAR
ncbi:carbohydrate-binding domain-containing protein [uncultured Nocardioides sp.]|jgi:hypothetical protein|uniref:carbohydrate-binding domain-containing protein n=1 Tax=uncultured Nocardioides sp. TaxID=198441 RepID=UPI0026279F36|nr:carbohydrate-binding domain-containing protein [uncultured Nocardioides sp.]